MAAGATDIAQQHSRVFDKLGRSAEVFLSNRARIAIETLGDPRMPILRARNVAKPSQPHGTSVKREGA